MTAMAVIQLCSEMQDECKCDVAVAYLMCCTVASIRCLLCLLEGIVLEYTPSAVHNSIQERILKMEMEAAVVCCLVQPSNLQFAS